MSIKRFVSALLTGALCLGVLTACGSTQKPASSGVSADAQRYSTIFYDAFDTVTQVIAYCDSEEEFSRQMDALHADLLEYHRLYDIYNDYDGVVNVKTINDNAGVAPVQVDDKILGMLELARQMYDTTNGKLNIAMGSVLRIWHDYREAAEANTNEADNKLPEQEALDAAARHAAVVVHARVDRMSPPGERLQAASGQGRLFRDADSHPFAGEHGAALQASEAAADDDYVELPLHVTPPFRCPFPAGSVCIPYSTCACPCARRVSPCPVRGRSGPARASR